jgi:hypothetical protein
LRLRGTDTPRSGSTIRKDHRSVAEEHPFFDEIAKHLVDAEEVLVVGPADTKLVSDVDPPGGDDHETCLRDHADAR